MKKHLPATSRAASRPHRTEACLTVVLLAGLVLPAFAQFPNPNQAPVGVVRPRAAVPVPVVVPATPALSPTAGPVLVGLAPARNQRNAPVASTVSATFSEALTNNAATLGALRVFSSQRGGRLSGLASVSGNTLSFDPNTNFRAGETVSTTITTAVQGATGNLVQPQVFQFIGAAAGGSANLSTLAATPEVQAGSQPFNLALGDLDGDGDLDIAAPQFGVAGVSIRLNNGLNSTNFITPATNAEVAVGGAARSVVLGDIDGDGDLDMVATQNFSGSSVSVRVNNGSGVFTAPAVGAEVNTGSFPLAASLTDIDGDGDLDLLVANNNSNTVSVRFNNGGGVFTAPATNGEVSVATYPLGMAMADIDNDGDMDMLVPSYNTHVVSVRLNNGSGVFTAPAVGSQIAVGTAPVQVAVGDLDGDGDVDLVSGNFNSNSVSVRLNTGGVLAAPATNAEVAVASQPEHIALADLDGDGDLDVLSADQNSNVVSVRLNNGSGVFTAPATNSQVPVGAQPSGLAVGDLDGDGDVDFATGNYGSTTVSVRLNQGTPVPLADLVVSSTQNVSGSYNNVTITGTGAATLTGTLSVSGALTVQSGGKLTTNCQALTGPGTFSLAAGATLNICDPAGITLSGATGAVQLTGTRSFSSDASYVYNGTAAQVTGSGLPSQVRNLSTTNASDLTLSAPTSVAQVLTVSGSGNLQLNGQRLTLLSSAAGTALLVNNGTGTVQGATGAMQRYIDGSGNPAGVGYRHYSAPVTGSTVADLATAGFTPVVNPAYNSAATPTAVTPFPTVFGYDQSRLNNAATGLPVFDKGFFSPASTAALTPGRGYTVNIGTTQVVDFVGSFNQGNFSLSNLNRSAPIPAAGAADQTGWHLVGNPYPSPLDWGTVTNAARSNVDAAVYVYQSTSQYGGVYRSFVNGAGAGSGLIAAGQGFFVRASSPDSVGRVALTNANRVTSFGTQPAFQRTTATRPQVQLTLSNGAATLSDDVFVYAETGATAAFDGRFDAYKLPNTTGLNVAALSSHDEPLSVQGLAPLTAAVVVPLQVSVPAAGTYTLRAAQLLNLPAGTYAYLRDVQAGVTIDLQQQPAYSFAVSAAGTVARFELHLTQARVTATAPAALSQQVLVYPNPARSAVTVELPAELRKQAHTLSLRNALGQPVRTFELPAGAPARALPLTGLSAGVYTLTLTTPQGVVVRRLVVE